MTTFPPPATIPEVTTERNGSVQYFDCGGIQIAIEPGDGVAMITILVPVEMLQLLRALLTNPQLAALLSGLDARPPVA